MSGNEFTDRVRFPYAAIVVAVAVLLGGGAIALALYAQPQREPATAGEALAGVAFPEQQWQGSQRAYRAHFRSPGGYRGYHPGPGWMHSWTERGPRGWYPGDDGWMRDHMGEGWLYRR